MLLLNHVFSNAEEFKMLFGTPEQRTAKLRLAILKSHRYWELMRKVRMQREPYDIIHGHKKMLDRTMPELSPSDVLLAVTSEMSKCDPAKAFNILKFSFMQYSFRSQVYKLNEGGICIIDRDHTAIRYMKDGKVYKMRAAKLFRKIAEEHAIAEKWGDAVLNYCCEVFQREWEAYAAPLCSASDMKLVVDDDFESIYDRDCYADHLSMNSCMTNQGYDSFYTNCVKASAASLRDEDDRIYARCVIFDEVHDDTNGKVYRLSERLYSIEGKEIYQRILLNKLITEGYIDGYKTVGASCGDANTFMLTDGTTIFTHELWIDCHVDGDDAVSYQDSFKWYDSGAHKAWNNYIRRPLGAVYDLATTEGTIFSEYDNYHDRYCRATVEAYVHGELFNVDEDDLDDFEYLDTQDRYVFWDDVVVIDESRYDKYSDEVMECPGCGEYFLCDDGEHSDITGDYYCCEDCKSEVEEEYIHDNWYYSKICGKYFEYCSEREEAEMLYALEHTDEVVVKDVDIFGGYEHGCIIGHYATRVKIASAEDVEPFVKVTFFRGGKYYDNATFYVSENVWNILRKNNCVTYLNGGWAAVESGDTAWLEIVSETLSKIA